MEGETNFPRITGLFVHQITMEQTQQVIDLGTVVSADLKPSLQYHKAAKKAWCSQRQLERTVGSRRPTILLSPFKAFVRLHLEYCV